MSPLPESKKAKSWKVGKPALRLTGKFFPIYDAAGVLVGTAETESLAGLIVAAPDMAEALQYVRELFRNLEAGTDESDSLRKLREKFHAPLKEVINSALLKAGL